MRKIEKKDKRVGASVVIDGQNPVGPYGPYPGLGNPFIQGPYGIGPGIPPPFPGIGIPNPCGGCPPPFFPPLPFPGLIVDDRIERPICDNPDTSITAGIAPQTIPANSTSTLLLSSALTSSGGANISGSNISLPREGVYSLSLSVTASRSSTSTDGVVSFILNGGVSGAGTIAGGSLLSGTTQVFSGSATVRSSSRRTTISILVNNTGGPLQILGGTLSVQLLHGRNHHHDPLFF